MKKLCYSFCLTLIALCFCIINSYAYNDGVNVFVMDKILSIDAIEENGYSLAPLRAYFESLGYTVNWNGDELSVTAKSENTEIKMVCNEKTAYINGKAVEMPCPMREYNGTTYAPVRSVAELSGFTVDWHDASKTAVILSSNSNLEFYPNTPHLIPKLENVVESSPIPISEWTDEKTGLYYKYEGLDEASILKYCELLEQNYSLKYDSMQLGDDYSKYYIYVSNRTCLMAAVKPDGVYIFPSVASSFAYEPIALSDKTKMPQPDINDNQYNNDTDIPLSPDVAMYENTNIPEFSHITGCTFIKQSETESGYPVYVYYGSMFEIIEYLNFLTLNCGFSDYTMSTQPFEMAMAYSISKGDTNVVIVYKMMTDTVYVSFEN